jgi:hypothetical protein
MIGKLPIFLLIIKRKIKNMRQTRKFENLKNNKDGFVTCVAEPENSSGRQKFDSTTMKWRKKKEDNKVLCSEIGSEDSFFFQRNLFSLKEIRKDYKKLFN